MAAQNAQMGVAKSAYFPSIGISGGGGFSSGKLANLIGASSSFWAIGANVAELALSGGRRKAQVDFATSGYGVTVASYRQSVLTAFQEVEDGLSGLDILSQAAQSQQHAVAAAQPALNTPNDHTTAALLPHPY